MKSLPEVELKFVIGAKVVEDDVRFVVFSNVPLHPLWGQILYRPGTISPFGLISKAQIFRFSIGAQSLYFSPSYSNGNIHFWQTRIIESVGLFYSFWLDFCFFHNFLRVQVMSLGWDFPNWLEQSWTLKFLS